jgi:drug/metabolite transporter (DMT)-like permease
MHPLAGAFLAVVLWSLSFVATKTALLEITPATLVTTRFGIGVAVLMLHLARRRLSLPSSLSVWARLATMGAIGIFLHQLLQASGLTLTTAMNTGWLIGLTPVWSAVLAALVLGERFGLQKVGGLALGFAGTVLVISGGAPAASWLALPATRGDLLVLASTVTWAIYTILGRGALAGIGSARATAGAMLCGWLMLLPVFAAGAGWREYERLSAAGWSAVVFLGIGCSGLGYLLWYAALEKVETTRVASLLYLEPLMTCAAAWLWLDESLHAITAAGGLMVLGGVALVQKAPAAGGGDPGPAAGYRSKRSEMAAS